MRTILTGLSISTTTNNLPGRGSKDALVSAPIVCYIFTMIRVADAKRFREKLTRDLMIPEH